MDDRKIIEYLRENIKYLENDNLQEAFELVIDEMKLRDCFDIDC